MGDNSGVPRFLFWVVLVGSLVWVIVAATQATHGSRVWVPDPYGDDWVDISTSSGQLQAGVHVFILVMLMAVCFYLGYLRRGG